MPETANELTDELLRRIRDPDALSISRPQVRSILSHTQRALNAKKRLLLATEAISTERRRLVYWWPGLFEIPPIALVRVRFLNATLERVTLDRLAQHDREWPRRMGDRIRSFAEIGELLILYPGLATPSTVSITYIKQTADLVAEGDSSEIPDHYIPLWLDLAEAVLLLSRREFAGLEQALKTAETRMLEAGQAP